MSVHVVLFVLAERWASLNLTSSAVASGLRHETWAEIMSALTRCRPRKSLKRRTLSWLAARHFTHMNRQQHTHTHKVLRIAWDPGHLPLYTHIYTQAWWPYFANLWDKTHTVQWPVFTPPIVMSLSVTLSVKQTCRCSQHTHSSSHTHIHTRLILCFNWCAANHCFFI